MMRKLFALVSGECVSDSPDSPMNQELMLPGHLYCAFLKVGGMCVCVCVCVCVY